MLAALISVLAGGVAGMFDRPCCRATDPEPAKPAYVVHEWGTFTNFSGPDGVQRRFVVQPGEDLPAFVISRPWQAGAAEANFFDSPKFVYLCLNRMETPVAYFYSDLERTVDVRVDMPRGLMTEFYPGVHEMAPPLGKETEELDHTTTLLWRGVKITRDTSADGLSPCIGNHNEAARQTDAQVVEVANRFGTQREKFLFYRGVANFDLPVRLKALGKDRFVLSNTSGEAVSAAFVMELSGDVLRFAEAKPDGPQSVLTLPTEPSSVEDLGGAMERALVGAGLYEKEAAAMVKTWKTNWFDEVGTRVLYIVPETLVNRAVPLTITPPPEHLKRVFVGRMDILTPEGETGIESVLAGVIKAGAEAGDRASREAWKKVGQRFGRFAAAAVECTVADAESENIRAAGNALLGR